MTVYLRIYFRKGIYIIKTSNGINKKYYCELEEWAFVHTQKNSAMNKALFKQLEKKANWEQKRLVPIVGHWYKINFERDGIMDSSSLRPSFKLCIKIADHKGANVYLMGIDYNSHELVKINVFSDEVQYAEWPKTNKFHHFCLVMLNYLLGEEPSEIDIYKDYKLYVLMETILLPKVISAKTVSEAIEGAKKAVEKGTRARLNVLPYGQFNAGIDNKKKREEVQNAFNWLLQEFSLSKH